MPVKKANTKNTFARAKRKIKDAGLSMMLAAAALAPIRGAAQGAPGDASDQHMDFAVSAISRGVFITNASSPDKKIDIKDWARVEALGHADYSDIPTDEEIANVHTFDTTKLNFIWGVESRYAELVKKSIERKGPNEYVYNTDALFDMYRDRLCELMPQSCAFQTKDMKLHVTCFGSFDQVDLYNISGGTEKWVASIVIKTDTEEIMCYSDTTRVRVYRDPSDRKPWYIRLFDGKTITRYDVLQHRDR